MMAAPKTLEEFQRWQEATTALDTLAAIATAHESNLFHSTLNPMHAWRAYKTARDHKLPIPPWVLVYLDDVATHLLKPGGAKSPRDIAHSLALMPKGRRGPSAEARAATEMQRLAIIGEINRKRHARDPAGRRRLTVTTALGQVADEMGLSVETVKAIYERRR